MYNFENAVAELSTIAEETKNVIDQRAVITKEIHDIENKHWKRVTDSLADMALFISAHGIAINQSFYTGIRTAAGKYVFCGMKYSGGSCVDLRTFLANSPTSFVENSGEAEWLGNISLYRGNYNGTISQLDSRRREIADLMYYEWETIEPVWGKNIADKVKEIYQIKLKSAADETNKMNTTLIAKRKAGC